MWDTEHHDFNYLHTKLTHASSSVYVSSSTTGTETKFAGSSCNDLVTTDSFSIISGHFDKKIRFWDTRTADCTANDIPLQGKITSLDLSKDGKFLLCCVRDDTINLLDLRQNKIVRTFRYVESNRLA